MLRKGERLAGREDSASARRRASAKSVGLLNADGTPYSGGGVVCMDGRELRHGGRDRGGRLRYNEEKEGRSMPSVKPISDLQNYPEAPRDVPSGSPVGLAEGGATPSSTFSSTTERAQHYNS